MFSIKESQLLLFQIPGESLERILFHLAGEEFSHALKEAHLLHQYELPLSSTILSLITTVAADMVNSPAGYSFTTTPRRTAQPLSLLALMNRGNARRDGRIRLLPHPVTQDLTIQDLATDRFRFSHEKCIDNNKFVIHLGEN